MFTTYSLVLFTIEGAQLTVDIKKLKEAEENVAAVREQRNPACESRVSKDCSNEPHWEIAKDHLVHFLLVGGLFFAAYAWIHRGEDTRDSRHIEVAVYKIGDKCMAVQSNEFGYANYEVMTVE